MQPAPDPAAEPPVHVELGKARRGLWRNLVAARRNILEVVPNGTRHHRMLSSSMLGRRFHLLTDPEGLRHVLKDRVEDYPKAPESLGLLKRALGKSLFMVHGQEWRFQRRAVAPVFAPRNLQALAPIMADAASRASERLAAGETGRPTDIGAEMLHTAFDVIAEVSFAGPSAVPREVILRAIDEYLDSTGKVSVLDFAGLPGWVPRPERLLTSRALRETKRAADAAIEARRKTPNPGTQTLLDLMIEAEDPRSGRRMTTEELRDNLITFLIAGHETTALTLSWALYLLAYRPDVQERARAQVRNVLRAGQTANAGVTHEDVAKMPFLRMILHETMRLYPPVAMHLRRARAHDTVAGTEIRPGDTLILPIYSLHRSRLWWKAPDHFRPGRFSDMSKIDRFAYLPFLGGPRICVGAEFAMLEMMIVLATLLRDHRFALAPGRLPEPQLILSLRSRTGFWLDVSPA